MITRNISVYDLMFYPESKQAILNSDKKALDKILFDLGMDIKIGYELREFSHRPLKKNDNLGWYGGCFVGFERQDYSWTQSEHCSWENRIELSGSEMRDELLRLGRQGSSEKAFVNESSAKKAIAKEQREIIE